MRKLHKTDCIYSTGFYLQRLNFEHEAKNSIHHILVLPTHDPNRLQARLERPARISTQARFLNFANKLATCLT